MNKNLCIRRAIKRNRFGAERRAEWGRIHQPGDPDKAEDRLGPTVLSRQPPAQRKEGSSRARAYPPPISAGSSNCCREIYSTYTYARANARAEGLYRSAAVIVVAALFSRRNRLYDITLSVEARDIRFMRARRCTSVLYPTSASHPEYAIFQQRIFSFPFLTHSFFLYLFFF